MAAVIGVIGGSGFYTLGPDQRSAEVHVDTPFDPEPVPVFQEDISGNKACFLSRHGSGHKIPPHRINYRANIHALKKCGVEWIIAVNVVGGISENMSPGTIVIPDQIIDYTWGREHTFFDALENVSNHIDFTWPYDASIGDRLARSAEESGTRLARGGVYACTQGPRLETAAEILKLRNDGCDIVGMTGMPEAALARELGIPYGAVALVVNRGAGLTENEISFAEIESILTGGIGKIRELVLKTINGSD